MSTFFDPTADATEASEALRGLAHASRTFDQPAQMYGVIGDLSAGMRSLHQVKIFLSTFGNSGQTGKRADYRRPAPQRPAARTSQYLGDGSPFDRNIYCPH